MIIKVLIGLIAPIAHSQNISVIDSFNHYYDRKYYQSALDLLNTEETSSFDFELLKRRGNCYHYLGNYDSSLQIYQRIFYGLSFSDTSNLIDISINIGNAWRSLREIDSTIYYLNLANRLNHSYESEHEARLFLAIGQYYEAKQFYDSAEYYFLKTLDLERNDTEYPSESILYMYQNLIQFYQERGDFEKAILYGNEGLNCVKNSTNKNRWWLFNFNYNIGRVYYALRDWQQVVIHFNKAMQYMTSDRNAFESYINNVLNYCYDQIGEYTLDERSFSNLNLSELDTMAYIYHLNNFGNYYENSQRDYQKALQKYKHGFTLNKAKYGDYHKVVLTNYWVIGRTYHKYQKYDSSLYYFQRALYCNTKEVDTLDYATNPSDVFNADKRLPEIMSRKLESLIAIKQQPLSRDSLQSVNRLIVANCDYYGHCVEARLHNKTFMQDRLAVLKKEIRKYMLAGMDAAHALYQDRHDTYYLEKALQFSETGKYLLVKSMMSSRDQTAKLPVTLSRLNTSLVNRINSLHTEIKQKEDVGNTTETARLKDQLFKLILQKDSVRNIILQQYPETIDRQFKMLTYEKIKSGIMEGQMLCSYFLEDTVLHIVQLTPDSVYWVRNENANQVREMAGQVVAFCNPTESNPSAKTAYLSHATTLTETLLGDTFGLRGIKELILVPDRELNLLPFEALLSSKPDPRTPYRELPYLLYDFTFSYHHSLYPDREKIQPDDTGNQYFVAVAPDFTGAAAHVRDNLSSIVEAGGEAAYLADLFSGKLLSGSQATKTRLEPYLEKASVIHFATHTRTDTTGMFNTGLMLAGDTAENIYEPFLTSEICCSDMQADLVMLSACSSGNGLILDGEGVISLGWAFRYAGCKSVGISLFPIDDAAARTIITSFYTGLREGMPKNQSLRAAKLEFLKTVMPGKTHPKYWAGLTVVGDQSAIGVPPNPNAYFKVVLVFAMLIILMFLIIRRNQMKKN